MYILLYHSVSRLPRERLPQHGLEPVGLPHHPEVARMRAIGRGFGVVAEQVVTGEIVETFDAVFLERVKARAQRGVVVGVGFGERWENPRVGLPPILHQHDRCGGSRRADLLDQRHAFKRHGRGVPD